MVKRIQDIIKERILVLDGAMGTMIQSYNLTEEDFRGRFHLFRGQMKGNNDVLNLSRPDIILDIHRRYLRAGADIIETNSFNCNRFSLADYGLEDKVYEIAKAAAEVASSCKSQKSKDKGQGEALATIIEYGSDTFKTWEDVIAYFSRLGGQ